MKKTFFILLLLFSCNKNEGIFSNLKKILYLPSKFELIDFRKSEDFLTDGSTDELFVLRISEDEYEKFVKKNRLIKFKDSYLWANYHDENYDFYPYNLKNELNLPNCKDFNNLYYNNWSINNAVSIECFLDANVGIVSVQITSSAKSPDFEE